MYTALLFILNRGSVLILFCAVGYEEALVRFFMILCGNTGYFYEDADVYGNLFCL